MDEALHPSLGPPRYPMRMVVTFATVAMETPAWATSPAVTSAQCAPTTFCLLLDGLAFIGFLDG